MTLVRRKSQAPEKPKMDGVYYTGEKGPKFGVRYVQMVIIAFSTGVMLSTKGMFSVLIVAMIKNGSSTNPDVPYYTWNNTNVIISAILWGGLPFQLLAGYLGKEHGPKWLIVGTQLINSIAFFIIPFAAQILGSTGVILCRLVQGVAQGAYSPLQVCVGGIWTPPEERARLSFIGSCSATLTIMVSSIVAGVVSKSSLGWPWGFYSFGALNLAYAIFYMIFGHQSPETHPSISPEEKMYIQVSLSQQPGKNIPTPWRKIFLSTPVWAIVIAQIGINFFLTLFSSDKSLFLDKIMKYDIQSNGVIGSIPTLCACVSGVGIAYMSDYSVQSGRFSVINSRRIFHLMGSITISILLIVLTYIPSEYRAWAIVDLCFIDIFIIFTLVAGSYINIYDVSPLFSGIIHGISNTLADAIGILAPLTVQWCVTGDQENVEQWRTAFGIASTITIVSGITFAIFATDKRQEWEGETPDVKLDRKLSILSLEEAIGKF
ncbi:putative inorganic phosphate cotransporter [Sitophilus oryzae]|uniref:Inorganic phosphate cotransporter n=1 Tax=Sitophilus oryzae TaxID=7048 RepID=A0A6J2XTL2_SITOR|nr:putative inorganic phosphate cotransporter [Sitophilus oryzae]